MEVSTEEEIQNQVICNQQETANFNCGTIISWTAFADPIYTNDEEEY